MTRKPARPVRKDTQDSTPVTGDRAHMDVQKKRSLELHVTQHAAQRGSQTGQ